MIIRLLFLSIDHHVMSTVVDAIESRKVHYPSVIIEETFPSHRPRLAGEMTLPCARP